MLSARALAEKSADMPRRISLWLATCRSTPVPAVLSFAKGGSSRSTAASKRASVSTRLERSQVCAFSSTCSSRKREVPEMLASFLGHLSRAFTWRPPCQTDRMDIRHKQDAHCGRQEVTPFPQL